MRRTLPCLSLALAFALVHGCSCDPPAVADRDGGASVEQEDDAGVLADAGPDDAGPDDMALSGSFILQREDGSTQVVDLPSGAVLPSVANAPFLGAVTSFDGALYGFVIEATGIVAEGRLARFDVDTGEVERLSQTVGIPSEVLVKADEAATVYGDIDDSLRYGPIGYEHTLLADAVEYSASAATYLEDGTLWTSSPLGTGPFLSAAEARVSTEHCGGLSQYAGTDELLCARVDGSGIVKLNQLTGSTSPLDGSAPLGFRSALALADGGYLAVGLDCDVISSRELPDLSGVCPYGFAELGGSLFAGLREGGVLEITAEGEVRLRASAATHPGGVASANGHSAVAGSWWREDVLVVKQGGRPRSVGHVDYGRGVALMDDGELWILQDGGVKRAGAEEVSLSEVHERDDLDQIAAVGRQVYFSVDGGGLVRLSADDGPGYALSDFADVSAQHIAGCSEVLLVEDDAGSLLAYASDGTSSAIGPAPFELAALGCADDQIVLASPDGTLVSKRLADVDGEWRDVAVLAGEEIRHIAGWSASE